MTIEILVPDLPESVADATVATWHKKAGDAVKRDEVIVEIETDKVVLEVPAQADGVLSEIVQDEGATVVSKQLLGKLETSTTAATAMTEKTAEPTPADRRTEVPDESHTSDALSPAVRRLLAEHDIQASEVKGTGVGGRITREDVEAVIAKRAAAPKAAETTVSTMAYSARSEKRVPMTRLRKRIAERLLEAKNNTAKNLKNNTAYV